ETLQRIDDTGIGAPKLEADLGPRDGKFNLGSKKVTLNAAREGKAASAESLRSTIEHEVDHAHTLAENPHLDPRTAATPAEASARLVELEARGRARQLQAADAQVERILSDGEMRPAQAGVDAAGRPTYSGELEAVLAKRGDVIGAPGWDAAHAPENVARLRA